MFTTSLILILKFISRLERCREPNESFFNFKAAYLWNGSSHRAGAVIFGFSTHFYISPQILVSIGGKKPLIPTIWVF